MSKGRLIMLAKPDLSWATHRLIVMQQVPDIWTRRSQHDAGRFQRNGQVARRAT